MERGILIVHGRHSGGAENMKQSWFRDFLGWIVLSAFVLVPFIIFGEDVEKWINSIVAVAAGCKIATALVLFGILSLDIFLPVPSCLLSAMCGASLGVLAGFFVSFFAMTASALVGFAVGRFCSTLANRLIGSNGHLLDRAMPTKKPVFLFLMRPVPVLSECSAVYAGLKGYQLKSSVVCLLLGNAVVSMVYALIGHYGRANDSFVPSFIAVIILSGIGFLFATLFCKRSPKVI